MSTNNNEQPGTPAIDADAPKVCESVGWSEWIAPLYAAHREKAEEWRKRSQEQMDQHVAMAIYEDMTALKRVIEIMRSRGAIAKISGETPRQNL